ncbi:MAG: AmmeMemoRadiSam system protein B [Candidatus Latescibacteria bacterium]|nr:AmmeMemoRadiSam system protein B [Candidatus Latescibacterota bacterium]
MVRHALWDGKFYPGDAKHLATQVDALLAAWPPRPDAPAPWALLVPHAGYPYSGACAAAAYAGLPATPSRVLLLGPNHHRPLAGFGLSRAERWETPLGDVEVDAAAVDALLAGGAPFAPAEEALALEHSLEVQLPFLQRLGGESPPRVLPILVGRCSAADREEAARRLGDIARPGDLWVVTTDLSHFHALERAEALDAETARLIEAGDADAFALALAKGRAEACGAEPVLLLLAEHRRRGGQVELLDRRDSSPVTGDRREVVGYLSARFTAGSPRA